MKLEFALSDNIGIQITSESSHGLNYPSGRIQKGLVLFNEGEALGEEGVGFGVPILKRGLQTIFPGEVELFPEAGSPLRKVSARYKLNLEEKLAKIGSGTIDNRWVYASKNMLAAVIRQLPFLRKLLTQTSNLMRSTHGWETTYEPANFSTYLSLTYLVDAQTGRIIVELDGFEPYPAGISEVVVMNEQGAHHFDQYQDTDGNLMHGSQIGCWDPVHAEEASFVSRKERISFSLRQVTGARLYRGRELIGTRLAWSGFGYSFPPSLDRFSYDIMVKRLA
jgi:hypothetical protein